MDNRTPPVRTGELVRRAIADRDGAALTALLDPMIVSDALRELLALGPADRELVLELVSLGLAAELIEEAPIEVAVDLVERLEADERPRSSRSSTPTCRPT